MLIMNIPYGHDVSMIWPCCSSYSVFHCTHTSVAGNTFHARKNTRNHKSSLNRGTRHDLLETSLDVADAVD
jgi:hypothetical protein